MHAGTNAEGPGPSFEATFTSRPLPHTEETPMARASPAAPAGTGAVFVASGEDLRTALEGGAGEIGICADVMLAGAPLLIAGRGRVVSIFAGEAACGGLATADLPRHAGAGWQLDAGGISRHFMVRARWGALIYTEFLG